MRTILWLFFSLFSINAFSFNLYQFAHSEKLGIKVLVETKDDKWCSNNVNLYFKADRVEFFQGESAQQLVSKLSNVIESECPSAESSDLIGYITSPDQPLLLATIKKKDNWQIVEKKTDNTTLPVDATEKSTKNTSGKLAKPSMGLDIKGLKLGMSNDDARSFLETLVTGNIAEKNKPIYTSNSQFKAKFEYLRYISSYTRAKKGNGQESYFLYFPPIPNESNVVAIVRDIVYGQNESPTKDGFIKALSTKYGTPSDSYERGSRGMENQVMIWAYDENNQQLHSEQFKQELTDCVFKSEFNILSYQEKKTWSLDVCKGWTVLGTTFKAYPENGSGTLRISLINHYEASKAAKRTLGYFAQIEKEKEMKVKQKMQQNTPSL